MGTFGKNLDLTHTVLGTPLHGPWPAGLDVVSFGMGCFWGAERFFWKAPGVHSTSVGYQGGHTADPTYEQTCTGRTGHAEVVQVVYDPAATSFEKLLRIFWENHDSTQGMRQGNDIGSQYRSAIFTTTDAQLETALASKQTYQRALTAAVKGTITTEIAPAGRYWYAETYHQQYLDKNPGGYCNHGFNGVSCPIGLDLPAQIEIEVP